MIHITYDIRLDNYDIIDIDLESPRLYRKIIRCISYSWIVTIEFFILQVENL